MRRTVKYSLKINRRAKLTKGRIAVTTSFSAGPWRLAYSRWPHGVSCQLSIVPPRTHQTYPHMLSTVLFLFLSVDTVDTSAMHRVVPVFGACSFTTTYILAENVYRIIVDPTFHKRVRWLRSNQIRSFYASQWNFPFTVNLWQLSINDTRCVNSIIDRQARTFDVARNEYLS